MPVTPQQLLNELTPEIESVVNSVVNYIDEELRKKFYGIPVTITCSPGRLPIPVKLFIQKIEHIYSEAGWGIKGIANSDQRDGDWIEFRMQSNK